MTIDDDAGEDRQDGVINICIRVENFADPWFPPGPLESSLPRDFRGSETERLFVEGVGLFGSDRTAKALRKLRRAEAMARTAYGPKSPALAWILNHVGIVCLELNRSAEAEAALREALAIREETLDAGDPCIAVSLNNLGNALLRQGRGNEGLPPLARAVQIESKAYGPDSRHTMFTRLNLVVGLADAGRNDEAIRELKKVRTGLKRHGRDLSGLSDIPSLAHDLSERLGV